MSKSIYWHKSHNVSVLIYHIVFPCKYRKAVLVKGIDDAVKEVCLEIEKRYDVKFLEIGTDIDHIHFLVQSVPTYNVTKIVTMIKSVTAKHVFMRHPEVKKQLWGGEFWSNGYFASTVGRHGDEQMISKYVQNQGIKEPYTKLHVDYQLKLFE